MNNYPLQTIASPVRLEKNLSLMTGEFCSGDLFPSGITDRAARLQHSAPSRLPKRKRVRFAECGTGMSSTILVESRHELTQFEKNAMWVTKSEFLSTLREVSQSIEECFSACSQVESTTYMQALPGAYILCCNAPNNSDNDSDEASVVQLGLPLARTLAQGGTTDEEEIRDNDPCGILVSTPSPLQLLRGLEQQVLPQLANERSCGRFEHVSSLVQLQQLVRETPESGTVLSAIAKRLSQPSRRFAALMGAADALTVSSGENDYFARAIQNQESSPVVDSMETSSNYFLLSSDSMSAKESRTRKRSAEEDLEHMASVQVSNFKLAFVCLLDRLLLWRLLRLGGIALWRGWVDGMSKGDRFRSLFTGQWIGHLIVEASLFEQLSERLAVRCKTFIILLRRRSRLHRL